LEGICSQATSRDLLDVVFGKVEVKGERPPEPMEEERSIEEYRNFLVVRIVPGYHHDR
jgi:hypothetical protein